MDQYLVRLIDPTGATVATAEVKPTDGGYQGIIDRDSMSQPLRVCFERFEQIVETQTFSLLDQVEDQIESLNLRAAFDHGLEASIIGLQIYPEGGTISFQVTQTARSSGSTPQTAKL